jgi:hypothetical protein
MCKMAKIDTHECACKRKLAGEAGVKLTCPEAPLLIFFSVNRELGRRRSTEPEMKAITLRAHFDGEQIRLDDPFQIQPDSPLTVTVWPQEREEEEALALLSGSLLADVPADEPEYSLDLIKEPNPDYEGG